MHISGMKQVPYYCAAGGQGRSTEKSENQDGDQAIQWRNYFRTRTNLGWLQASRPFPLMSTLEASVKWSLRTSFAHAVAAISVAGAY
jgi:hypothetical protein